MTPDEARKWYNEYVQSESHIKNALTTACCMIERDAKIGERSTKVGLGKYHGEHVKQVRKILRKKGFKVRPAFLSLPYTVHVRW